MIRISKETSLKPEAVIEKAGRFFGKDGEGMEEKDRTPCCIFFEGAGGHVSLNIAEEKGKRTVELEAREWEYQAKKFLEQL